MTPPSMGEIGAEFQALIEEGWRLHKSLSTLHEELSTVHDLLRIDLDDINRAHGIAANNKTKKRVALTLVKTEFARYPHQPDTPTDPG